MKCKHFFSILFSLCFLSALQAEDKLGYMGGFGSRMIIGDDDKSCVEWSMEEQLDHVVSSFQDNNGDRQFVIGQSLGGIRAIAYAHKVNKVQGVVTIDAPVCGWSPVSGGQDALKERIQKVKKKIEQGAVAAAPGIPLILDIATEKPVIIDTLVKLTELRIGQQDETAMLWMALKGGIPGNAITGMTPGSTFIQENVAPSSTFTPPEFRAVQSGWLTVYSIVWERKKVLFTYVNVPVIKSTRVPTYSFYLVKPGYFTIEPKIPPSTYVGQVVGDNSDAMGMLKEYAQNHDMMDGFNNAEKYRKKYLDYTEACKNIYFGLGTTASLIATYNAPNLAVSIPAAMAATVAFNNSEAAKAGHTTVKDFNETYSYILGTEEHDGLIPVADQSMSQILLGGRNYLYSSDYIWKRPEHKIHHENSNYHPAIWGTDGGMGKGVKTGGILHTWLSRVCGDLRGSNFQ